MKKLSNGMIVRSGGKSYGSRGSLASISGKEKEYDMGSHEFELIVNASMTLEDSIHLSGTDYPEYNKLQKIFGKYVRETRPVFNEDIFSPYNR